MDPLVSTFWSPLWLICLMGLWIENFGLLEDSNRFQDIEGVNIYDILEPCYHSPEAMRIASTNSKLPASFRRLGETERPLAVRTRMFGRAWPLRAPVREGIVPTWPELLNSNSVPCTVSFFRLLMLWIRFSRPLILISWILWHLGSLNRPRKKSVPIRSNSFAYCCFISHGLHLCSIVFFFFTF